MRSNTEMPLAPTARIAMNDQSSNTSTRVGTSQRADAQSISELLRRWLDRQADDDGLQWLDEQRQRIAEGGAKRMFFTSFSAVPRYIGKKDLQLSQKDLQDAEAMRTGWQPRQWSVDQAGRALVLLSLPHEDANAFLDTLEQVFVTADVGESVALYQSIPLLPYPERLYGQATEGVRSNMTSVFEAIALDNPYPADYFDATAWNQMVLKAVFVGSPLHRVYGLDRRANPKLARMLVDYAHERWAADRSVTPELWRPVGPFAEDDEVLDDLERVLTEDDPVQREAAALALSQSPAARADDLLSGQSDLRSAIAEGRLTWSTFTENRLENK